MAKSKVEQELIAGMQEALSNERGERKLKSSKRELTHPAKRFKASEIRKLRIDIYHMTQLEFAAFLNVKVPTIRAWEQNQKHPSGAAARLLEIAQKDPSLREKLAS